MVIVFSIFTVKGEVVWQLSVKCQIDCGSERWGDVKALILVVLNLLWYQAVKIGTRWREFTLSQSCPSPPRYFSLPQLPQASLTRTKRQPLLQKSFYPRPCAIPIWVLKYLFFPISHLMGPRISGLRAFYQETLLGSFPAIGRILRWPPWSLPTQDGSSPL